MNSLSTRGETEKYMSHPETHLSVWKELCSSSQRGTCQMRCRLLAPQAWPPGMLISEPSLLHTVSTAHVCSLHLCRAFLGQAHRVDTPSRRSLLLQRSRRLVAKLLAVSEIWTYPWPHPESQLHSRLSAPGVSSQFPATDIFWIYHQLWWLWSSQNPNYSLKNW